MGGRLAGRADTTRPQDFFHLYRHMLEIFPELAGVGISHDWSGYVGFTRDTKSPIRSLKVREVQLHGINLFSRQCHFDLLLALVFELLRNGSGFAMPYSPIVSSSSKARNTFASGECKTGKEGQNPRNTTIKYG